MDSQLKQFLRTVESVKFHDGSSVEGYEKYGNPHPKLRFRGVRSDGHTEIDFLTAFDALSWVWELNEKGEKE